jgi:hypothetical protein
MEVFYNVNEIIIEQRARDIWYYVSVRHLASHLQHKSMMIRGYSKEGYIVNQCSN